MGKPRDLRLHLRRGHGYLVQRQETHPASDIPLAHNAAIRASHHVDVIELSEEVLYDAKFMKCNPGYVPGMPCGDAQYMEVDLGIRLRAQGFGVWQS